MFLPEKKNTPKTTNAAKQNQEFLTKGDPDFAAQTRYTTKVQYSTVQQQKLITYERPVLKGGGREKMGKGRCRRGLVGTGRTVCLVVVDLT